jgi:hypothetical protein
MATRDQDPPPPSSPQPKPADNALPAPLAQQIAELGATLFAEYENAG